MTESGNISYACRRDSPNHSHSILQFDSAFLRFWFMSLDSRKLDTVYNERRDADKCEESGRGLWGVQVFAAKY